MVRDWSGNRQDLLVRFLLAPLGRLPSPRSRVLTEGVFWSVVSQGGSENFFLANIARKTGERIAGFSKNGFWFLGPSRGGSLVFYGTAFVEDKEGVTGDDNNNKTKQTFFFFGLKTFGYIYFFRDSLKYLTDAHGAPSLPSNVRGWRETSPLGSSWVCKNLFIRDLFWQRWLGPQKRKALDSSLV